MSKKLAEGIDALVLDVKFGSGAFMKTSDEAAELAQTLVRIGEQFGKQTIAYLTNMEQPLGYAVGNWLEVKESIDCLKGNGPEDVMEITYLLAGTMIYLGKKAETVESGIEMSKKAVQNGTAFQKWLHIVEEQGGDRTVIKEPVSYEGAAFTEEVTSDTSGYITEMDAYAMGMVSVELGAGRKEKEDDIDPDAGFILNKKIGDRIETGETFATLFTNKKQTIHTALKGMKNAISVKNEAREPLDLITHRVDKDGIHNYRA